VSDTRIALLEAGLATTRATIAGVRPEQMDAPTPCTEWTVRDLLNHIIGGTQMFAAGAAGRPMPTGFDPFGPPPDVIGDNDALATYDAAVTDCLAAWRANGITGTLALLPGEFPAEQAFGIQFCDNLVHGWDLARATGQDNGISPELGEAARSMLEGNVSEHNRGRIFADPQPVADDAPAIDRLAAYLGRPVG
jgi:uncharacterized protein (TIGR03086 family)